MSGINSIYGDVSLYDDSQPSLTTPTINIISNSNIPSIEFNPSFDDGSVPSVSGVMRVVSGVSGLSESPERSLYICKDEEVLLQVKDKQSDGSILYIKPVTDGTSLIQLSNPSRIITSNTNGDIGMITSLSPSLGGTGLSTVPGTGVSPVLIGGNGISYIPIQAGNGVNLQIVNGIGVLSASGDVASVSSLSFDINPGTGVTTQILSGDGGIYPVEYTAPGTGNNETIQVIATFNISVFTMMNIRVFGLRKRGTIAYTSEQRFLINRAGSNSDVLRYGVTSSSVGLGGLLLNGSAVSFSLSGTTLSMSSILAPGDKWKGIVEIVGTS